MNDRLKKYFDAPQHNDLMVKGKTVDERTVFAVQIGTILVRTLDKMSVDPAAMESAFELGSGEGDSFEIIVRRKRK